jgi:hypothetical protein
MVALARSSRETYVRKNRRRLAGMKLFLFVVAVVVVAMVALALRRKGSVSTPPSQGSGIPAQATVPSEVSALLKAFDLRERDTGFLGSWQEAAVDGSRVGFQLGDLFLIAHVGRFDADREQLTELYLGTVCPSEEFPGEDSDQRIDRFLDDKGKPLARRFILYATGPVDYPQLRIPEVRDGLTALSRSILEVGLYEGGGMQLQFDTSKATATSVESDVRQAVAMVRALDEARVPRY